MRNEKANEQKFETQLHILQILLSINNMNFNNMNESENVLMDVSHKLLYVEKEVVRKGNRFPLVGMRGYLRYMKFKRKGLKIYDILYTKEICLLSSRHEPRGV